MASFHAYHNGRSIESITAADLTAAKRYFTKRYGKGKVEVKGDGEVVTLRTAVAAKEDAMQIGTRVSGYHGAGTIVAREMTPKTGLFVTVKYDSGMEKSASAFYLSVL